MPRDFYDMSLSEWEATLEGAAVAAGHDLTPPPKWDDFEHLRHRMGPSKSIR